ncbi:MAG: NAD(P)/FAD-dependent oxidoreductase [Oscillospiraceae bacterium]|jgi:predicted Rossmann fold flavoprotein|nr:NAD(P)/FAD-dependent oxidoreductase [Oscillospiraceae bacterium]
MKVMIIGGGASGMMAALAASERQDNEVLLLERQARVGRKLLVTGNGRCNLSNRNLSPKNYHGENPAFSDFALQNFGAEQTLAYFAALGLRTTTQEDGRVYPRSDSANSVLDVLRLHLAQRKNVSIHTACEVLALRKEAGSFQAQTADNAFSSDRVIVCAGGLAGGKYGGTDFGYRLLAGFGHTRTKLYPALVQIKTQTDFVRPLKGVRCDARATLFCASHELAQSCGELQFTDYGVSGPMIFELSRQASVCAENATLLLDFVRELSQQDLLAALQKRRQDLPDCLTEDFLTGFVHNRLGRVILRRCACALDRKNRDMDDELLRSICKMLKAFPLAVLGTMDLQDAQVTAGGIKTADFRKETLESRLCPGLYAAGEVLDIDGDCGGYNLQWAWSSGRLAGMEAGR